MSPFQTRRALVVGGLAGADQLAAEALPERLVAYGPVVMASSLALAPTLSERAMHVTPNSAGPSGPRRRASATGPAGPAPSPLRAQEAATPVSPAAAGALVIACSEPSRATR